MLCVSQLGQVEVAEGLTGGGPASADMLIWILGAVKNDNALYERQVNSSGRKGQQEIRIDDA